MHDRKQGRNKKGKKGNIVFKRNSVRYQRSVAPNVYVREKLPFFLDEMIDKVI